MEAGERYPEPVLVHLVQRIQCTGAGERSVEKNDVRYGAVLHHDMYDIGKQIKLLIRSPPPKSTLRR